MNLLLYYMLSDLVQITILLDFEKHHNAHGHKCTWMVIYKSICHYGIQRSWFLFTPKCQKLLLIKWAVSFSPTIFSFLTDKEQDAWLTSTCCLFSHLCILNHGSLFGKRIQSAKCFIYSPINFLFAFYCFFFISYVLPDVVLMLSPFCEEILLLCNRQ